jgi:hypothetical protein
MRISVGSLDRPASIMRLALDPLVIARQQLGLFNQDGQQVVPLVLAPAAARLTLPHRFGHRSKNRVVRIGTSKLTTLDVNIEMVLPEEGWEV